MYLTYLKAMIVEAVQATFDASYPVADFANVHADIEYPVDQQSYPGIWVDYADTQKLTRAGVDHQEWTPNASGSLTPTTRWEYQGVVTLTTVALSSLERDRLFDELIRVIAFGPQNPLTRRFRDHIDSNDFIAANINFDEIDVQGNAAAPGTPWGTDEIMYEKSIQLDVRGEFVADNVEGDLVALSKIIVTPTEAYVLPEEAGASGDLPTDWH